MKLLDWLAGKSTPGDEQPYETPPDADRPATPFEIYLLCACIHFSFSALLPILFYSVGGQPSETSVTGAPALTEGVNITLPVAAGQFLYNFGQLLHFPMSWILGYLSHLAGAPLFAGLIGYIPLALNSLLWGVPIYYAYLFLARLFKRERRVEP